MVLYPRWPVSRPFLLYLTNAVLKTPTAGLFNKYYLVEQNTTNQSSVAIKVVTDAIRE